MMIKKMVTVMAMMMMKMNEREEETRFKVETVVLRESLEKELFHVEQYVDKISKSPSQSRESQRERPHHSHHSYQSTLPSREPVGPKHTLYSSLFIAGRFKYCLKFKKV